MNNLINRFKCWYRNFHVPIPGDCFGIFTCYCRDCGKYFADSMNDGIESHTIKIPRVKEYCCDEPYI